MMKRIGLLCHPRLLQSKRLAAEIERVLLDLDVVAWVASSLDDEQILSHALAHALGTDCIITLGGDGTIIRAARIMAEARIPILGVNMGRVGFLAETEPKEIVGLLPTILERKYRIEERTMLHIKVSSETRSTAEYEAVNDVVVGRGGIGRVVRVSTHVDGEYLTTYVADGLIVATATGSTAYALAAGGPILDPELEDFLLVPVASHLSMAGALVLPGRTQVRMEALSGCEATLTVDGQINRSLEDGDRVLVERSAHRTYFIRLSPPAHFYRTLVHRLRRPDHAPER